MEKHPSKVLVHWTYKDQSGVYEADPNSVWWDDEWKGWDTFYWDDGNGGCDCNRAICFWGAGRDWPCGNTIEADVEVID